MIIVIFFVTVREIKRDFHILIQAAKRKTKQVQVCPNFC